MKRHTQVTGVRRWAGEDLIDLQAECLKIIDSFFEEYGPCIIKGCEIGGENPGISPGIVALQGFDHDNNPTFKVVPFPGASNIVFPVYLTLSCNTLERVYTDGKVKPVAYDYRAEITSIKPEDTPYLEITSEGGKRFVDATGITSKLNYNGNAKDVTVTFSESTKRENVTSGEKLSSLLGKIRKFFSDLKAVAFSGKAADLTEDTTHRFMTDTERTKLNGIEAGANKYVHPDTHSADMIVDSSAKVMMTSVERTKLNGIATGANKYVHPDKHLATIITEDTTHRFMTDTERAKLNGIEAGANKYSHPSSHSADMIVDSSAKVMMTPAERTKLGGIATGANKYVHPDKHPATVITEDTTHRFMTDTERTKLNGIEAGANKYSHPSSHSADMIVDSSAKVMMTATERSKLAEIETGANKYVHPTSHLASIIQQDATHRFVSDTEKTKWNGKMEFACAGVITKTAAKDKYWGSTFSVIKSGTGYYRIKHELNKEHQVLAMCINAAGEEGFATIPYRSNVDFFIATNNINGRQDMAFFFIIFTL